MSSVTRYRRALALLSVAGLAASAASAGAQGLPPLANNPAVLAAAQICQADVAKLCPGVIPGGGRIIRCLADQQASVSPNCREAIFKAKEAIGR
jgi:hypothetical protein